MNPPSLSLEQALDLILAHSKVLGPHMIPLSDSYGRICTDNNLTRLPLPGYDQSTRDGYAVRGDGRSSGERSRAFLVKGEIRAGQDHQFDIEADEAYRIMTGGLVPGGTERIITQEDCRVSGSEAVVPQEKLTGARNHIRRRGSEIRAQQRLFESGTRLTEYHLSFFAAAGNDMVEVFKKPRVAFFCTGSELVASGKELKNGQKFSSNHLLLESLVREHGGRAVGQGVVADENEPLKRILKRLRESESDVVISTGGVGPGKYDLVSSAFRQSGGVLLYQSLALRPGRSTLFGILGDKLYFGLPGPPSAVRVLFNELIGPPLKKIQGMQSFYNQRVDAFLDHEIRLKSADMLCFQDGCFRLQQGRVLVTYPRENQAPNCTILMMPGRTTYKRGDTVTISPIRPVESVT